MPIPHKTISKEELSQLENIWSIAASFSFPHSPQTLDLFLQALNSLLNAKNTWWLAATHGSAPSDIFSIQIFDGWWAVDVIDPQSDLLTEENQKIYFDLAKIHGPGEDTIAIVNAAGNHRVQLRQDIIPDHQWDNHWKTKQYHIPILGIKERMHTVYNVSPTSESYFMIDRAVDQPPFTEHDRTLARLAITGSATLHRKLLIERGLTSPATKPLSPREKETFPLLFSHLTKKEIAEKLGVSTSTAHQYINAIYQKFLVKSRHELLAKCI